MKKYSASWYVNSIVSIGSDFIIKSSLSNKEDEALYSS